MTKNIQFVKEIYSGKAIEDARNAYSEFCSLEITENENHFSVTFKIVNSDKNSNIVDEIKNYILLQSL